MQPEHDVAVSRLGVVALLACGLFTTIGLFAPGLVLPLMVRDFAGVPNVALLAELIGTVASFAFAVGAPVAGWLIGRFGCRRVMAPALVLFAITGALPALLNDLWLILAARVGVGLALAGVFTGSLSGLGALPAGVRMRMFGWFSVVGGAAAIVMFPAIGAIGAYGWRPAFLVNLVALLAVPLVLVLPRALGVARAGGGAHESGSGSAPLIGPAMAGLLAIAALVGMGMLIGPIYSPLYLSAVGIVDTRLLAIPITLGSIAAVFASALYGRLHDRLGLAGISAMTLLAMGVALVVAGTTAGIIPFTVALIVHSAMTAIMAPNISASALAAAPPEKASQAIGLANGVMFGAQLAFPFIATWVRGLAGLSGVFLTFGAAMLAAGAMVAVFGRRRARVAAERTA